MSFSKCSNLEAKRLHTPDFVTKDLKSSTITSNKQNSENKVSQVGFMNLKIKIKKKFKLKTKLTKTKTLKSVLYKLCRIFSASKRHLRFQNPFTGSEGISTGEILFIREYSSIFFYLFDDKV